MSHLKLGDLLDAFSGPELAKALVHAGLQGSGTKIERIERLRAAASRHEVSAPQVLDFFSAEALRSVAFRYGIRAASKAELIHALSERVVSAPVAATSGPATLDSLCEFVQSLAGARRKLNSEADAEVFLASALADRFSEVRTQAPVLGHFGHRIDIDIQNGRLGVEVKFAPALIESSSEAYRLLGQSFYYDRRRYAGRLLVVVVGPTPFAAHPIIAEISDLLGALGVTSLYLNVD